MHPNSLKLISYIVLLPFRTFPESVSSQETNLEGASALFWDADGVWSPFADDKSEEWLEELFEVERGQGQSEDGIDEPT
jgi:hypothetical protein